MTLKEMLQMAEMLEAQASQLKRKPVVAQIKLNEANELRRKVRELRNGTVI